MARSLPIAVLLLSAAAASAQTAGEDSAAPGRRNQRIEKIVLEDSANRIEELRVGGQTQSITVQPKGSDMPPYEIEPGHLSRSRPADNRNGLGSSGGTRYWNVFRF